MKTLKRSVLLAVCAAGLPALMAATPPNSGWNQARGDFRNSGYAAGVSTRSTLSKLWTFNQDPNLGAPEPPVAMNGRLYTTEVRRPEDNHQHALAAIHQGTGALLWTFATNLPDEGFTGIPACQIQPDGSTLIWALAARRTANAVYRNVVYCLKDEGGSASLVWRTPLNVDYIQTDLTLAGNALLVSAFRNGFTEYGLVCLRTLGGTVRFEAYRNTTGPISLGKPVVDGLRRRTFAGVAGGFMVLDESGAELLRFATPRPVADPSYDPIKDRLFLMVEHRNQVGFLYSIQCYNGSTGTLLWDSLDVGISAPTAFSCPVLVAGRVFASVGGTVVALNGDTGAPIWTWSAGNRIGLTPLCTENAKLWVPIYEPGSLVCLDAVTGQFLSENTDWPANVYQLCADRDSLYGYDASFRLAKFGPGQIIIPK